MRPKLFAELAIGEKFRIRKNGKLSPLCMKIVPFERKLPKRIEYLAGFTNPHKIPVKINSVDLSCGAVLEIPENMPTQTYTTAEK